MGVGTDEPCGNSQRSAKGDSKMPELCPGHLEMLLRDALKRIFGNGNVEEKEALPETS